MSSLPAERSIVILGAGVIGLSTAYYISTSSTPTKVYVLDTSPILFQCASGRAAGFITKDWFSSSLAELGELSFRLHRELADRFDGRRNWGYSGTIALSLNETDDDNELRGATKEKRGEDWLFDGDSRRAMAGGMTALEDHQWPQWLRKAGGHVLSTVDSTAQV
jgi:glycine/D-amino acid oxidase-like deaminating enzyme